MVSRIRYRVRPPERSPDETRDLSTRRDSTSTTSSLSRSAPAQTASAASRPKPPANTESLRNRARSASVRSSWLQSMVARRVCWRGVAVLLPLRSARNRSSSLEARSSSDITEMRAAASSKASGIPSSREQIPATRAAFCWSSRNDGSARVARSTNNATASDRRSSSTASDRSASGRASGLSRHTTSPGTSRTSLLVARTVRTGHLWRRT